MKNDERNSRSKGRDDPKSVPQIEARAIQFHVAGLTDQKSAKWISISKDGDIGFARREELAGDPGVWRKLASQGPGVMTSGSKRDIQKLAEGLTDWSAPLYLATTPGWHADAFVTHDGDQLVSRKSSRVVVALDHAALPTSRNGTLDGWKRWVERFAKDQPLLTFVLSYAFVGPILDLLDLTDNPIVELFGPSSTGKTTFANAAQTVWSAPLGTPNSWGMTWNTTVAGLEQHMLARRDGFLFLDDASRLGLSRKSVGDKLSDALWLLNGGAEKSRQPTQVAAPVKLATLSTSNQPLRSLTGHLAGDIEEATLVRIMSVPAEAGRGLGVWERLPSKYRSTAEAIAALRRAAEKHHGQAGSLFLKELRRARSKDERSLQKTLRRGIRDFCDQVGIDKSNGLEDRVARMYGAVYAAGTFALSVGALPKLDVMRAVEACYLRQKQSAAATGRKVTAVEEITEYAKQHRSALIDLDIGDAVKLSKTELDAHPGFLKTIGERRYLLVRTKRAPRVFRGPVNTALKALEKGGRLYSTDHRQIQLKVRQNRNKDRMYALRLD